MQWALASFHHLSRARQGIILFKPSAEVLWPILNWKFGHFMCCFSFYCAGKPVELETWNSWNCHFLSVTVNNYGRFQCYSSLSCSASCRPASHLRCSKSYGLSVSVFSHFTACPVQPASPIHFTYNKILLSLLSLSWYLAFVSSLQISTKLWHLFIYTFKFNYDTTHSDRRVAVMTVSIENAKNTKTFNYYGEIILCAR